ncbi:MAG: methyltransferase domain-containing protein [Rhodospirillales bacterium]|nr:methyltransferase domain-containing protein [Rhodospirillales bacterium]
MNDEPNAWELRYQESRTGWQREDVSPALLAWLADGTLKPCRILVPGAGRSHEPLHLAQARFQVTTLDIAPSAVAHQRAGLAALGGTALEGDVLSFDASQPFDVIYEQTCLCALPPDRRAAYAAQMRRWLRPGGVLAALFMQTGRDGGPPFHCALPDMRALLPETAWRWPDRTWPEVPHGDGLFEIPLALIRI